MRHQPRQAQRWAAGRTRRPRKFWRRPPGPVLHLDGVTTERLASHHDWAITDAYLSVERDATGLVADLEYCSDVLDAERAHELLALFESRLRALVGPT